MDLLTPRQNDIVALAKSEGRVSVEGSGRSLRCYTADHSEGPERSLRARGLQRYHGGAVLASGIANFGYEAGANLLPKRSAELASRPRR